uniref:Uncharacterized protein n=1 Tax=Compsopogon caeruleus TaxID=31354 RepID=A0A7S1T899_9RHOD
MGRVESSELMEASRSETRGNSLSRHLKTALSRETGESDAIRYFNRKSARLSRTMLQGPIPDLKEDGSLEEVVERTSVDGLPATMRMSQQHLEMDDRGTETGTRRDSLEYSAWSASSSAHWADNFIDVPPRKTWQTFMARISISGKREDYVEERKRASSSSRPRFGWRVSYRDLYAPTRQSARILSRSRQLSFSESSGFRVVEPSLSYAIYGKCFSTSLFTLYHNAVRRELRDLYRMIRAVSISPRASSLEGLGIWMNSFDHLIRAILMIHEQIIFPWIESVALLESRVDRGSRMEMQNEALSGLEVVQSILLTLSSEAVDEGTLVTLIESANELGAYLLRYFELIERKCPPAVEMFFTETGTHELETGIRERLIHRRQHPEILYPSISRWLSEASPGLHSRWSSRLFRGRRRIQMRIWMRQYLSGHIRIVERLSPDPMTKLTQSGKV